MYTNIKFNKMTRRELKERDQLAGNLRDSKPADVTPPNQEAKTETQTAKIIVQPAITKSDWGFGSWRPVSQSFKNISTGFGTLCTSKTYCAPWN
jgi:hypothetical protein